MNFYQDLTLIDNSEVNLGYIWQKVYQQVHIALVENGYSNPDTAFKSSKIAVSFPAYADEGFPLGNKLRVLAPELELLNRLDIESWLSRLRDYVHISPIKDVPRSVKFICFRQKRVKGEKRLEHSLHKKAAHISERFGEDLESTLKELKKRYTFHKEELPYIHVESQTNKTDGRNSRFKLFIEKVELKEPQYGTFDCYGLSKTATVPWFQ